MTENEVFNLQAIDNVSIMVRVLDCHSFKAEKVISVQDEPLAICADEQRVFVATRRCNVVVYTVGEKCKEQRRFETISLVEKLHFNSIKNYFITLEYKRSWKNISKFIRVYLSWDIDVQQGTKLRTKVRIAGKSHPSLLSVNQSQYVDVVEIPADKNITDIGVCEQTGNFAIAVDREVKVYHLVEKTVPNSGRTYRDVEVFLELCWNFRVSSVSLCENYIACASICEFQVVRLEYIDASDSGPSQAVHRRLHPGRRSEDKDSPRHVHDIPSPSSSLRASSQVSSLDEDDSVNRKFVSPAVSSNIEFSPVGIRRSANHSPSFWSAPSSLDSSLSDHITDDEYFHVWRFDGEDLETGETTIHLQGLQGSSRSLAQKAAPPVLQDLRGGPFKSSGGVRAFTLLYLSDIDMKEDWKDVMLVPSYLPGLSGKSSESWASSEPLRSVNFCSLIGICCYISGLRGGSMYSLLPKVRLLSSYRYMNSAIKILQSRGLFHIVSKTGLETYTSRCGCAAVFNMEGFDNITKACPPEDLEVCLCGIQPFIGTKDIATTSEHLILLSKVEDPHSNESIWSLYALQHPSPVELYRDMVSFGCQVQETGPASYLHLVQEAHLLLKVEQFLSAKRDVLVEDHFLESCALLGEYYSLPDEEQWQLCLPYYTMSNLSVEDIVRQAVQNKQHSKQDTLYNYGKGLLHYLNHRLFQDDENLSQKESTGNTLLDIYMETEPENLSHVILTSQLQTYSLEKALDMMKKWVNNGVKMGEKASPWDLLAMVKLDLLMCEPESAESTLAAVEELLFQKSIISICASNPHLVHKDFMEFSAIAQLMRRHRPSTFLHLLVELHDRGAMTVDSALKLLQHQFGGELYKNNQVKEFLEIFVNDIRRRYIFEDVVPELCEIYIKRLTSDTPSSSRRMLLPQNFHMPQGSGHFAPRFSWLDHLPPFSGPKSMSKPCHHISVYSGPSLHGQRSSSAAIPVRMITRSENTEDRCSCCFCNEDLIKIQSLLCSEMSTSELCQRVHRMIQSRTNMVGWDSIWLLCSRQIDIKQATEFIIDRFPAIMPKFATASFALDKEKWEHGLRCLEAALKELSSSRAGQGEEMYVKAYRDILQELAWLFPPADFLHLLPVDGSFAFLLPYITRSMQQEHAKQLKMDIINKGKQYMSMHK